MTKPIVYLDQNVVSDLACLRIGPPKHDERGRAVTEFYASLTAATENGRVRCVECHFHRLEATPVYGFKAELYAAMQEIVVVSSWGLKFLPLDKVTENETLEAVADAQGLACTPPEHRWVTAFDRDPQEPRRLGEPLVAVPWSPEDNIACPGWAAVVTSEQAEGLYAADAALEQLRAQRRIWATHENHLRNWASAWSPEQLMDPARVAAFIASEDFFTLPSNDVLVRLGAKIVSRVGKLKDSDAIDLKRLCLAIPYCDMVITDSQRAGEAKELGLDRCYSTTVFGAKTMDLQDAAAWLRDAAG